MNEDSVRDLLSRGIAAARSGDKKEAGRYLEWALRLNPSFEQRIKILQYLSEISDDPSQQRYYLQEILIADPNYQPARRALAILDGQLKAGDVIDPDRKPAPGIPPADAPEARSFTCPSCGGRLTFAPDGQSLLCERCENQQRLVPPGYAAATEDQPQTFTVAMSTLQGHTSPAAGQKVTCRTCGASFSLPAGTLSATCPYCGNAHTFEAAHDAGQYPVQALVPFRVDQNQALEALRQYMLHKHLSGRVKVTGLRGFYQPAWQFTLLAPVPLKGAPQADVQRQYTTRIEDLLVPASPSLPEAWQSVLDSFDLASLQPFDPAYLANWHAETYTTPLSDASLAARFRALQRIQTGQGTVRISSMDLMVESYRLILVPLWTIAFTHQDKRRAVLINGQTGQVFDF